MHIHAEIWEYPFVVSYVEKLRFTITEIVVLRLCVSIYFSYLQLCAMRRQYEISTIETLGITWMTRTRTRKYPRSCRRNPSASWDVLRLLLGGSSWASFYLNSAFLLFAQHAPNGGCVRYAHVVHSFLGALACVRSNSVTKNTGF